MKIVMSEKDKRILNIKLFDGDEESHEGKEWKENRAFVVADITRVEYGNKFDKNKMTRKNPSINFVSRTATNNGISDFVDTYKDTEPFPSGTVTLALGGSIGSCFLQDEPYYTGQNVGVMFFDENVSDRAKLYFTAALGEKCKKSFQAFGNEINKHLKTDLTVTLPIQTNSSYRPVIDPTHKYHPEGFVPDWEFMDKYILELEQERIKELEQERIKELEQYLIVTGLNDYELTEEDKEILATKLFDGGAIRKLDIWKWLFDRSNR